MNRRRALLREISDLLGVDIKLKCEIADLLEARRPAPQPSAQESPDFVPQASRDLADRDYERVNRKPAPAQEELDADADIRRDADGDARVDLTFGDTDVGVYFKPNGEVGWALRIGKAFTHGVGHVPPAPEKWEHPKAGCSCLLYTSDAADE